jgi:hypothetical protein
MSPELLAVADVLARALVFVIGAGIIAVTLLAAIRTFVLPRSAHSLMTQLVFNLSYRVFRALAKRARTYARMDRIMALYSPVTLLILPLVLLASIMFGFALMFWALGPMDFFRSLQISGSSLLTLGFANYDDQTGYLLLEFLEAAIGMILIAMLISYLPTMYSAFTRRETLVTLLEVRAGSPPSPVDMIARIHRVRGLDYLHEMWTAWEVWFAEVDESHTSLTPLVFFRSPRPERSWVTAAGAVLDGAALTLAVVDIPANAQANLTLRAGYLALRRIADFFGIAYDPDPAPTDPISITRAEFDAACDELAEAGVPLKSDREQAWRDYAGWRVNYDRVLLALAWLTMAPYAEWSSDRSLPGGYGLRPRDAMRPFRS